MGGQRVGRELPGVEDTADESDETFLVNLSGAINSTIADNQATGTITDDDGAPSISIADASAIEGSALTFTLTLSNPSAQTVTVTAGTADGSARRPSS